MGAGGSQVPQRTTRQSDWPACKRTHQAWAWALMLVVLLGTGQFGIVWLPSRATAPGPALLRIASSEAWCSLLTFRVRSRWSVSAPVPFVTPHVDIKRVALGISKTQYDSKSNSGYTKRKYRFRLETPRGSWVRYTVRTRKSLLALCRHCGRKMGNAVLLTRFSRC